MLATYQDKIINLKTSWLGMGIMVSLLAFLFITNSTSNTRVYIANQDVIWVVGASVTQHEQSQLLYVVLCDTGKGIVLA